MPAEPADEALLQKYLLGDLSEQEQVVVEDRAFAEPGYLAALEGVEADLIDAYVRGELSQTDRRQFERRFLTSPQRRNKVEFARALATVAAESKPVSFRFLEHQSVWQALRNLFQASHPALRFAAGFAAVVAVAGASWLAIQNVSMRSRMSSPGSTKPGHANARAGTPAAAQPRAGTRREHRCAIAEAVG